MTQDVKTDLASKYQAKGAQQLSLQEYRALQEKKAKSKLKIPSFIKYILIAPFVLIFCFGIIFIPFLIYKAFTSPSSSDSEQGKAHHTEVTKKTSHSASE